MTRPRLITIAQGTLAALAIVLLVLAAAMWLMRSGLGHETAPPPDAWPSTIQSQP